MIRRSGIDGLDFSRTAAKRVIHRRAFWALLGFDPTPKRLTENAPRDFRHLS
jgi:hypothetical protein